MPKTRDIVSQQQLQNSVLFVVGVPAAGKDTIKRFRFTSTEQVQQPCGNPVVDIIAAQMGITAELDYGQPGRLGFFENGDVESSSAKVVNQHAQLLGGVCRGIGVGSGLGLKLKFQPAFRQA